MPQSIDTLDIALTFNDNNKLTWLDLHTVNPEPNPIVFEEIVVGFGGTSKGWLSKYVVDNYLNILVEKFNFENNSKKFGALNCNDSACILEN